MKLFFSFNIFFIYLFLAYNISPAQNNNSNPSFEIIVKRVSLEKEIKNGSLSYLKGCTFKTEVNVNGQSGSVGTFSVDGLIQITKHQKRTYVHDIKKTMPDGTTKTFPSRMIVIQ